MNRLLLVRHAVTEHTGARLSGWLPGVHLSDKGRDQAKKLAERLADVPVDALYASPLERCQETAAAIAEVKGLQVTTLVEVGEVRYGDWTGREVAELAKQDLWWLLMAHPSGARFPGGESLLEMQARAVAAVERLRAAHPKQTVAVCSHADPIKAVVAQYLGLHLDLFQRLEISPASVTAFAFTPLPRLLRLNDTGEVSDLAPRRDEQSPPAPVDGAGPPAGEEAAHAQP